MWPKTTDPDHVRSVFTDLLRAIRHEAGLRQAVLAHRLGQTQSFVSKYESGERRVDILELAEICRACGVSLRDFVVRFEELLEDNES